MLRKLTATVLPYCAVTLLLLVLFFFLSFLRLLPCTKWIVVKLMQMVATITLPTEVYWHSLFTWPMLKSLRNTILLELQKSARIDHPAPNPSLVSTDGLSHCRLFNFCKGNRPLVVNFCSWTCPVFRVRVGEFLSIVQEFSDVADFLTVYIDEAHPSNGWAFKNNVEIPAHATLEERCQAAKLMLDSVKFNCPVVVDTMENEANKAYAGLPIRQYVIKNQNVVYAGLPGPTYYNPKEVEQWLKEFRAEFMRTARHRA